MSTSTTTGIRVPRVVIDRTDRRESAKRTLRCGVVGVGRMGQHHARKYAQMQGTELVAVVDRDAERRAHFAEQYGCAAFEDERELLKLNLDAVTIAVPTIDHLRCATPLLKAGIDCLIEKPLSNSVDEAEQLVQLAERTGAMLMVGHIERFNPAVRALQKAERDAALQGHPGIMPRFIEIHRVSPMTFRSVDVSVVLDMMIHDLDVVLMLMNGAEPDEIQASGVSVLTQQEDICNARLTFMQPQGKCVVNITASRLALKTERKIRIIGDNGYVSIDYAKKNGILIRKTANSPQMEEIRAELRRGTDLSDLDYSDIVTAEPLDIDDADQLELEIQSFLDAVRLGEQPPIDARAGFANVRTAHRISEEVRKDWI